MRYKIILALLLLVFVGLVASVVTHLPVARGQLSASAAALSSIVEAPNLSLGTSGSSFAAAAATPEDRITLPPTEGETPVIAQPTLDRTTAAVAAFRRQLQPVKGAVQYRASQTQSVTRVEGMDMNLSLDISPTPSATCGDLYAWNYTDGVAQFGRVECAADGVPRRQIVERHRFVASPVGKVYFPNFVVKGESYVPDHPFVILPVAKRPLFAIVKPAETLSVYTTRRFLIPLSITEDTTYPLSYTDTATGRKVNGVIARVLAADGSLVSEKRTGVWADKPEVQLQAPAQQGDYTVAVELIDSASGGFILPAPVDSMPFTVRSVPQLNLAVVSDGPQMVMSRVRTTGAPLSPEAALRRFALTVRGASEEAPLTPYLLLYKDGRAADFSLSFVKYGRQSCTAFPCDVPVTIDTTPLVTPRESTYGTYAYHLVMSDTEGIRTQDLGTVFELTLEQASPDKFFIGPFDRSVAARNAFINELGTTHGAVSVQGTDLAGNDGAVPLILGVDLTAVPELRCAERYYWSFTDGEAETGTIRCDASGVPERTLRITHRFAAADKAYIPFFSIGSYQFVVGASIVVPPSGTVLAIRIGEGVKEQAYSNRPFSLQVHTEEEPPFRTSYIEETSGSRAQGIIYRWYVVKQGDSRTLLTETKAGIWKDTPELLLQAPEDPGAYEVEIELMDSQSSGRIYPAVTTTHAVTVVPLPELSYAVVRDGPAAVTAVVRETGELESPVSAVTTLTLTVSNTGTYTGAVVIAPVIYREGKKLAQKLTPVHFASVRCTVFPCSSTVSIDTTPLLSPDESSYGIYEYHAFAFDDEVPAAPRFLDLGPVFSFTLARPLSPDLAITFTGLAPEAAIAGASVVITGTVQNSGNTEMRGVYARLLTDAGAELAQKDLGALQPGDSQVIEFTQAFPTAGTNLLVLEVQSSATPLAREQNQTNNRTTPVRLVVSPVNEAPVVVGATAPQDKIIEDKKSAPFTFVAKDSDSETITWKISWGDDSPVQVFEKRPPSILPWGEPDPNTCTSLGTLLREITSTTCTLESDHIWSKPGQYTITITASDGELETTRTLSVEVASATERDLPRNDPLPPVLLQDFEASAGDAVVNTNAAYVISGKASGKLTFSPSGATWHNRTIRVLRTDWSKYRYLHFWIYADENNPTADLPQLRLDNVYTGDAGGAFDGKRGRYERRDYGLKMGGGQHVTIDLGSFTSRKHTSDVLFYFYKPWYPKTGNKTYVYYLDDMRLSQEPLLVQQKTPARLAAPTVEQAAIPDGVALSWSGVPMATDYVVHYPGVPGLGDVGWEHAAYKSVRVSTTSYRLGSLAPGTYTIYLSAVDSKDTTRASELVSILVTIPEKPKIVFTDVVPHVIPQGAVWVICRTRGAVDPARIQAYARDAQGDYVKFSYTWGSASGASHFGGLPSVDTTPMTQRWTFGCREIDVTGAHVMGGTYLERDARCVASRGIDPRDPGRERVCADHSELQAIQASAIPQVEMVPLPKAVVGTQVTPVVTPLETSLILDASAGIDVGAINTKLRSYVDRFARLPTIEAKNQLGGQLFEVQFTAAHAVGNIVMKIGNDTFPKDRDIGLSLKLLDAAQIEQELPVGSLPQGFALVKNLVLDVQVTPSGTGPYQLVKPVDISFTLTPAAGADLPWEPGTVSVYRKTNGMWEPFCLPPGVTSATGRPCVFGAEWLQSSNLITMHMGSVHPADYGLFALVGKPKPKPLPAAVLPVRSSMATILCTVPLFRSFCAE